MGYRETLLADLGSEQRIIPRRASGSPFPSMASRQEHDFGTCLVHEPADLRKEYGRALILWGNIDKQALAKGKEAIKAELDYKIPFLIKDGGYLPGIDHFIPPDVSLEKFLFYLEYMRGFM